MKGFLFLLCIVLIGFCGINYIQTQSLRQEIRELEGKLLLEQEARKQDSPMGIARDALDQVQDAVKNTDWTQAQAKLEEAKQRIEAAGKNVSERTKPGVDWMQKQYDQLSQQVKDKVANH
ncbi:MAG: hypothetical protein ABJA67_06260 [Chthonomonadales bacterium]